MVLSPAEEACLGGRLVHPRGPQYGKGRVDLPTPRLSPMERTVSSGRLQAYMTLTVALSYVLSHGANRRRCPLPLIIPRGPRVQAASFPVFSIPRPV